MGVNNGVITAPINPQEVYNLLGVGKYNGEYNINYICSNNHGKTNPCAKFKPVKYPSLDSPANYWKGTDEKCGFSFPATTSKITSQSSDGVWTYNPPVGGDASPFRILDFEGYYHNASRKWFTINIPDTMVIGYANTFNIGGTINLENSRNLTYYDTIKQLWISVSPNTNTPLEAKKEIPLESIKSTGGNFLIKIPGSEIIQSGAEPGMTLRTHLYGLDKNDNIISVRNDASVQTLWQSTMISTEAYRPTMRCQAVLRNSNSLYELRIYNLMIVLDANYYSGGTLAKDSRLRMYKYVSDSYNYIAYGDAIYEKYLPAMTVQAGKSYTYQIGYPDMEIVYANDPDFTQVMFIWQSPNGSELARLRKEVYNQAFN